MNSLYALPSIGKQTIRALQRHPERVAFSWDSGQLTYAGTADLIGRIQKVFMGLGLEPGSRVAFLSANRADAWCASVAAQLSRLAIVWLHPAGSLADHQFQIENAQARALIIDSATYGSHGGELATRIPEGTVVFTLGPSEFGLDLAAAIETSGPARPRCLALPSDLAAFLYSGGTTGRSKAAVRRHEQAAAGPATTLVNVELPARPDFLAVGPISHATGHYLLPTLLRGGTVHLARGFDPERVLRTIEQERINSLLLVPSMIYTLLDAPCLAKADVSSLESLLYAASPMSSSRLEEGIERIGPVFSQLYGLTECAPVTILRKEDHDPKRPELLQSCGSPAIGADVVLLDEDDHEVGVGEIGEICVRSPTAFSEYWLEPEQTADATRGGWLHTGDLARADEQGYLFILDRKKDMIVTGGFNVYPREVEEVLMGHPDVATAAVIGTPHDKWGEAVTAIIVPKPSAQLDGRALIELVKDRKGSVNAPKIVEFVDALPLTGLGKVDKKELRANFWANHSRMIG